MMQLFKITVFIDSRGLHKRIQDINVEEKGKSYFGEGKRINKDKLMKIDTMFFENHTSIRYFTYCLDGEQQKALNMLKKHVTDKVMQYKSEIDVLVSYLKK